MTDRRKFSEEEMTELAQTMVKAFNEDDHHCRYRGIDEQELREAVLFVRNVNRAFADSRKTVRNTMIKLLLTAAVCLLLLGAGIEFKKLMGPLP